MTQPQQPRKKITEPSESDREFGNWLRRAAASNAADRLARYPHLLGLRQDDAADDQD